MKPLLISSGEPAGIGPDLCLALAGYNLPLVVVGDKNLFIQRAKQLNLDISFVNYSSDEPVISKHKQLTVFNLPCPSSVVAGKLNPRNAPYVIDMLSLATGKCLEGEFSALVTAPIHKGIINQAGINFTGHTEFLANRCQAESVVMMLACELMRVALITTHLPLKQVAEAINQPLIIKIISQLDYSLRHEFNIPNPKIFVAGLNPHAGEGGYLGREETEIIIPAIEQLKKEKLNVHGPFPADTLFNAKNLAQCDAFVAMYHDQGLPVLKYASFGSAVNITLGLPIIRTSVDHGTALELAGTGRGETGSFLAAIKTALIMVQGRMKNGHH